MSKPVEEKTHVQLGLRAARHNAEIIGLFAVVGLIVTAPITLASVATATFVVAGAAAFGFVMGYGVGVATRNTNRLRNSVPNPTRHP